MGFSQGWLSFLSNALPLQFFVMRECQEYLFCRKSVGSQPVLRRCICKKPSNHDWPRLGRTSGMTSLEAQ